MDSMRCRTDGELGAKKRSPYSDLGTPYLHLPRHLASTSLEGYFAYHGKKYHMAKSPSCQVGGPGVLMTPLPRGFASGRADGHMG